MNAYHTQTAKFLSVLMQNMPELTETEMQFWIEHPVMVKAVTQIFKDECAPEDEAIDQALLDRMSVRTRKAILLMGVNRMSELACVADCATLERRHVPQTSCSDIWETLRLHGFPAVRFRGIKLPH